MFTDVFIDTSGAAVGIFCSVMCMCITARLVKKTEKSSNKNS